MACALALGFALCGCGGRSVSHVGGGTASDDTGDDSPQGDTHHDPGNSDLDGCEAACELCFASPVGIPCADLCTQAFQSAALAGCDAALGDLLGCRNDKRTCSTSACVSQNNALSVCVIGYCETHSESALCTAPF